jgi:hypothetical protein
LQPRCDDGTLPDDSLLKMWYEYIADASGRHHRPLAYNHKSKDQLRSQGFVDIEETIIRAPLNTWPTNTYQREVGKWYHVGLTEGIEAMSMALFSRIFLWSPKETIVPWLTKVKDELTQTKIHAYNNM